MAASSTFDNANNVNAGEHMQTFFRTILIGAALAVGAAAVASAAGATNPVVGTWTLNLEKSKFTPGPAPKSQTRTYAQTDQGTTLTVTGVAADGSSISQQATFKYDGKDYPISGSADYDTLALKKVNGSTVKSTLKLGGKVVGSATRTISAHGKVLTLKIKATNAKGVPYEAVAVFDKQ